MKTLEDYMKLRYRIELDPIEEDDGGGWCATIPQLGNMGFLGDGETIAEALENLEKTKRMQFEGYILNNIPIPEPTPYRPYEFEGRSEQCT